MGSCFSKYAELPERPLKADTAQRRAAINEKNEGRKLGGASAAEIVQPRDAVARAAEERYNKRQTREKESSDRLKTIGQTPRDDRVPV